MAAPLTLGVVTLAMRVDGDVLFPLLFTSVCWAAFSLRGRQVVANVLVTIAVSAVPLLAGSVGWEAGSPAESVGLVLVSAAGFGLVGIVVYGLASALRRGRLVSEAVVGALQDGLVIVNDGRISRVNERMCELTGFSEHELVGQSTPLPYWPPESVKAIRAINDEVIRLGQGEYDVVLCRKSGERFPAIVTIGVTSGRDSRVVMIKDVAERAVLVAETHAAREAFAHSAEVIGEYLYSGERKPDEQFVMHAHGRGLAALLGAPEETQELVDGLRRLHPSG